ncbi:MAG: protein BatD [Myxococcales bacterium FL481]|nr:MAG: protein BatD [Myxococcales bacterium FL481]
MRGGRRAFLVVTAALVSMPQVALASEVTIGANLSAQRVTLGEAVYLRVKVQQKGAGGDALPEPVIADIDGVQVELQGPPAVSQSSMFINGRSFVTRALSYDYALVPTREGTFTVDVRVTADGRAIRPDRTLRFEVVEGAAVAPVASGAQPRGDIFLLPNVDQQRVYVGQPVVYTFELWTRVDDNIQMRTQPTFKDFWSEELTFDEQPRRATLNGQVYRVHPLMRRALFPQKAGRLPVGAAEVEAHPSRLRSLFGRRRRSMPRRVRGPGIEIEAVALPAAGQPAGFASNNVGRFSVSAAVDRDQVHVGEGLTLTLTISGTGNLRFVEPGEFAPIDGAKRYDPQDELDLQVDERGALGGERRYKFLIVPEQGGPLEIPAHKIHFFDPERERYASAASQPLTVRVEGEAAPTPTVADAAEPASVVPSEQDDAVFAPIDETEPAPRVDKTRRFWSARGWTTAVLSGPVTTGLVWAGLAVRRRMGPSEATQRTLAREAKRRQLMARAEAAVDSGNGFFVAVGDVVHGIVMEQIGTAGEGLHRESLLRRLREQGTPESVIHDVSVVLEQADAARFGAGGADAKTRQQCLDRVRRLVDPQTWRATS